MICTTFIFYFTRLIKKVIIAALKKSINKLPTIGITKKAFGDGKYLSVKASMLAKAFGVVPNPQPQCPPVMIAAS